MYRYMLAAILVASFSIAGQTAGAGTSATVRPLQGVTVGVTTFTDDSGCPLGFRTAAVTSGNVTHLGQTEVENSHCFLGVDEETGEGLLGGGIMTFAAANGDELRGSYTGTAVPAMPETTGDVVVARVDVTLSGGTGRFAKATGAIAATAYVTFPGWEAPEWPTRVVYEGSVSY